MNYIHSNSLIMNNNVATVNNIYEAFLKGDVSTIMNYLSDRSGMGALERQLWTEGRSPLVERTKRERWRT